MSTTSAVTTTVVFLFSFTTTATTVFQCAGHDLVCGVFVRLECCVRCSSHPPTHPPTHPPSMSRDFHKILIERYRSFRPALPHLVKRFIHYVKTMYTNYDSLVKTRFLANEEQLRNIMIQHTAQLRLKVRDNARWCALCVAVKEKARWRGICACVELLN
jgi:hypothetical protein